MNAAPPRPGGLHWVLLTAAAAAIAVASWPAVRGMAYMWSNSPMYSYGWLVPAISGWLLWSQRERLAAAPIAPAPGPGLSVLAIWALMMFAGHVGGILLLQQLAIPVAIAGLVLVGAGRAALAASGAAIAYLLLGVPLWDGFTEPLHLKFQLLSAGLGIRMLHALGIPSYGSGVYIELPTMRIEVARACSGVNYLIAVLALGLPLAYLYLRTWWRRVLLIVMAMAIAALSNSLRVALICILVYYDLGAPLHGPAHVLHGLFVSGIGHVALFAGLWLLSRAPAERGAAATAPAMSPAGSPIAQRSWGLAAVAFAAAITWTTAASQRWYHPAPVPLAASLEQLPSQLGAWNADPFTDPRPPEWWLSVDHELRRRYQVGSTAVDVFIGYDEAQAQAREIVSYRAASLHQRASLTDVPVRGGAPLRVNVAREQVRDRTYVTLFWYEIDGRIETTPATAKLRTLWNGMRSRRTNGAVICLTAPLQGTNEAETIAALTALAGELHTALAACLPHRPPSLALAGQAAAVLRHRFDA